MDWPSDADGDALREMEADEFDFSVTHKIDFNVDIENWPAPRPLVLALIKKYGDIGGYDPEGEYPGYLTFQLNDIVTYDLIVKTQQEATELLASFGAVCESWAVTTE